MARSSLASALTCGFLLVCLPARSPGSEITKLEHEFWAKLYHELHPEHPPNWSEYGGRHAWAQQEKKRLESTVVEILRGNREDIPWEHGLFVARDIATEPICDALYARMEPTLERISASEAQIGAEDHAKLVSSLSILAEARDTRALEPLNRVVQALDYSAYSHITARKYLAALRKVGDATSLPALRDMPLRKTHEHIERLAALTERFIEARIKGKVFPPETAPQELRAVANGFLQAMEERDLAKLRESFPARVREHMDEAKLAEFVEWDQHEQALPSIRTALDAETPFDIDREMGIDQEYFQARLVCNNRCVVEFIYEIDGWKVMNVKAVGPIRRSDDPRP